MSHRWLSLGLLCFGIALAFLVRLAPAVAIPDLNLAFEPSMAQLALITSFYMWPFALMQPVAGAVADRLGPRLGITIFLAVAGIGQVVFALAPDLLVALIGRGLSGVGFSTLFVGAAIIMARWFRPQHFSTLTGLWTSTANIGSLVASTPLAILLGLAGWRLSFGMIGLAVLALSVLIYSFIRDQPTDPNLLIDRPNVSRFKGKRSDRSAPLSRGTIEFLRQRNTWLLSGYGFALFGTMTMTQGFFAVPFLTDVYDLNQQQVADHLTLWALGLIFGCTFWGFAADRLFASRKKVVFWGAVIYSFLWIVLAIQPDDLSFLMLRLAMLWGGFFAATWIPCYAILRNSVAPALVGTAMGIFNMFVWLGGAFYQLISGLIMEALSDASGATPFLAYHVVIWFALASVMVSVILIGASTEE